MSTPGSEVTWVTARAERRCVESQVIKTVTIENNPFMTLVLDPWAEEASLISASPPGYDENATSGHVRWQFANWTRNATVELTLRNVTGVGCL